MKLKTMLSCLLVLAMCLQLFACSDEEAAQPETKTNAPSGTVDLMADVQPLAVQGQSVNKTYAESAADFALNLLRNTYTGGNCVLSPYSVYTALAMCANGADTQTLAQMQEVLGMSAAELNVFLYSVAQNVGAELQSANSIWFSNADNFTPNADFLQLNADYYGADMFSSAFHEQTLEDINRWIREKTNGRIENALDRIEANTMMYLINALSFDAKWDNLYHSGQIADGVFHSPEGDETVQMMSGEESEYLADENATGFIKDYAGGQYSYVALLPNEGISVEDYLATLNGEKLTTMVGNPENVTVFTTMPKYEISYKTELNDALSAMGMPLAFSDNADFSRMSNLELKISRVLHQTQLTVDELGTQAGAMTIVEMDTKGVILNSRTVVLDRPFVMGIYDNVNCTFVFLGVVESVN